MASYLAGDIGGTNTRLKLLRLNDLEDFHQPLVGGRRSSEINEVVLLEKTYVSSAFPHLVEAVKLFIEEAVALGHERPVVGCVGIAGPVDNNSCLITNVDWPLLVGSEMAVALNMKCFTFLNDFVANGYGLLELETDDKIVFNNVVPRKDAPIAIIGAGTGLGEAYLTFNGTQYDVWGSEGGHADFAARNAIEFEVLQYLQSRLNIDHVSVERVVSGQALPYLYDFFRQKYPELHSSVEEEVRQLDAPVAAIVSRAGVAGADEICKKVMDLFVSLYGAEVGNLALKTLPYGGVYIAGGIGAKIKERLAEPDFIESFLNKGRMRRILQNIPVSLVIREDLGLLGAQHVARRHVRSFSH
eukprot:GILJ01006442.1.p1 GENE.GILJ01006442.1~~GILJ01006442.1.p1  ORF type:complete len:357 (-),score=52.75 GILJ01006442.1:313-1383(-)